MKEYGSLVEWSWSTCRKICPGALCSHKMAHGVAWDWTRVFTMTGRHVCTF